MKPIRSLRLRLIGALAALSIAAVILLLGGAWIYAQDAADRAYDRILSASALAIADGVAVRDGQLEVDLPYAALDMLGSAREDRVFYTVINPAGEAITGYGDLPEGDTERHGDGAVRFSDQQYLGAAIRMASLDQLITEPELSGWATIKVAQTRISRNNLAREVALNAMPLILALFASMLLMVWWTVTRGMRPLDQLSKELQHREPTELSPLEVEAPSEIAPVIQALNSFMQRLETTLGQLQRFIGDAAHQLRTPMTGLRAQAQLFRHTSDPDQQAYLLERIEENAQQTERLTQQLLSDAMVSHRSQLPTSQTVDLVEIIDQAIREGVPRADDRHEQVIRRLETNKAPILGDPVTLREAIRNLIENAVVHGEENAPIEIELHCQKDQYCLTVTNSGPSISVSEHERLMRRFERGDQATKPGSGLGLAIAAEVARQHRGSLSIHSPGERGVRVALCLPRLGSQ